MFDEFLDAELMLASRRRRQASTTASLQLLSVSIAPSARRTMTA